MFYLTLAAMVIVISLVGEASGVTTWLKEYGTRNSVVNAIRPTTDGGYIAVGNMLPPGRSVLWLLKLQADGTVEWSRTYAGKYDLYGIDVDPDGAGGYYVLGEENSTKDFEDLVIMRIDSSGGIEWGKVMGTMENDWPHSLARTFDGGCIVVGTTRAYPAAENAPQGWLLKMDRDGKVEWQRKYPYLASDLLRVRQMADGGYIACGAIWGVSTGGWEAWTVKLDSAGKIEWDETFERSGDDLFTDVYPIPGGGYLLTGWTTFYREGGRDRPRCGGVPTGREGEAPVGEGVWPFQVL